MRIKELHIYHHDLPVKNGPYKMAGQEVWSLETTIIQLITDNGIEGWGEVCPLGSRYAPVQPCALRALLVDVAPSLIGVEVSTNAVTAALDQQIEGGNYARSAIDIAVHDAFAKSVGLPVAAILGGAYRTRMPSYFAAGINAPDETARLAHEKVKEGYPRLQIKIGRSHVEEDIETLRKVHERVGASVRMAADANRALNTRDVIRLSQACADVPFTLEQPCNSIEEVAMIRPLIRHPLFLDESITDLNTCLRVIAEGLVDGFGMKLSRIGGLRAFAGFRDICTARGLSHTCDDSWGGDIISAAQIHMGAACPPKQLEGVWLASPYVDQPYSENPMTVRDGHVILPEGAGLGITPDTSCFGPPAASFGG